jgi:hypothetical protein
MCSSSAEKKGRARGENLAVSYLETSVHLDLDFLVFFTLASMSVIFHFVFVFARSLILFPWTFSQQ